MRKRKRVTFETVGPSLTKQQSKDECDINLMIARHGVIPPPPDAARGFVDVSMVGDYFESMQLVTRARQSFDALPAVVRKRFDNDPLNLVRTVDACLDDPEGHQAVIEELVELDVLAPSMLDRFGVPAEPGDAPVPGVPPTPASPPPADS